MIFGRQLRSLMQLLKLSCRTASCRSNRRMMCTGSTATAVFFLKTYTKAWYRSNMHRIGFNTNRET